MINKRKEARIGRPRIFDPSERHDLHVYLHPEQLTFILKEAHTRRVSPSHIIREWINERINNDYRSQSL